MYWIRHSRSTKAASKSGVSVVEDTKVSRFVAPAPALVVGVIFSVITRRFATLWTLRAAAAVNSGRLYGHSEIVAVGILNSLLFSSPAFGHDALRELSESSKADTRRL
jgi:hypothetical protein